MRRGRRGRRRTVGAAATAATAGGRSRQRKDLLNLWRTRHGVELDRGVSRQSLPKELHPLGGLLVTAHHDDAEVHIGPGEGRPADTRALRRGESLIQEPARLLKLKVRVGLHRLTVVVQHLDLPALRLRDHVGLAAQREPPELANAPERDGHVQVLAALAPVLACFDVWLAECAACERALRGTVSNGWDDVVPFGTLLIALIIFTVWHRLTL